MSLMEHKQFYTQHEKYKRNLQGRRTIMLKHKIKSKNR
jgi:hypothetical protein